MINIVKEIDQPALLAEMYASDLVSDQTQHVMPNNPERVAQTVGGILPYFRDVELLVAQYTDELNIALGEDEFRGRWLAEEVAHGNTIDAILRASGIVIDTPAVEPASLKFRTLGHMTRLSSTADRILRMSVAYYGTINESTNLLGQQAIISKLRSIEEPELARTFGAMARQERRHNMYYQSEVARLRPTMSLPERVAADWLVARTFTPVGANSPGMRIRFGEVMSFIVDDEETSTDMDSFAHKMGETTYSLLDSDGKSAGATTKQQALILEAFTRCHEEYTQAK